LILNLLLFFLHPSRFAYGFNQVEFAELFVCGFASSMVVGTFVGGLADKLGRKKMCIMYSVC
jgi:hypothetical protein